MKGVTVNEFVIFFFILLIPNVLTVKPIQFINGGYRGITVSIHSKVRESDELTDNLETLLRKSSELLYDVTGGRARFVEIDVIIPQSWSKRNRYQPIAGSFYDKSHIRIGITDSIRGDEPYTLQPRGCGESGEYIQLSEVFIKELEGKTKEDYGYPEKHFIHEWAHYRYGVFDEYGIPGDKKYPTFYIENGTILPTTCVKGIRGIMEDNDGKPCKVYRGGSIDSRCKFIPDPKENDARASLMFMPHLNSIDNFCLNDTKDTRLIHNKYAPSKHNILCNYQSTSEVIFNHEDFTQSNTSQVKGKYSDPVFQYYRIDEEQSSRFVLVLDVSGSMRDNGRIKMLNRAATRFVQDIIPNGMELGIIEFSTNATVLHEMTTVNETTRVSLAEMIPDTAEGWTAIGKAFRAAMGILQKNNGNTRAATIILVSDGENNQKEPTIEEIMPEVYDAGIRIDAIAVAVEADERLENISRLSGGRCFYMKDDDNATNTVMETIFMGAVTQQKDIEVQSVTIKSRDIVIIDQRNIYKRIVIDKELGKNTQFIVSSNDIDQLDVKFKSPDGHIYSENNNYYRKDLRLKNVQLTLPDSQTGNWEVIYSKSQYSKKELIAAALTVTSEPKSPDYQPIRLNAYFGKLEIRYPATALIYAEVKKGQNAVIGANVMAIIERPKEGKIEIKLYDDGSGIDIHANDGIYTTAFTQFSSNGRYSVTALVSASPETRLRTTQSYYANSYSIKMPKKLLNDTSERPKSEFLITDFVSSLEQPEESIESEPIPEFSRENEIGAFKLENYVKNVDLIAPGRVTDLRIQSTDEEERIVELQWTAPGDDLFNGNVSKIDLRVSKSQESLHNSVMFETNVPITEAMLLSGSLEPVEGGEMQRVKFQIPNTILKNGPLKSDKISIYFALRGIDKSNNTGDISNIAGTHFGYHRQVLDNIIIGTNSRPFETTITQSHIDLTEPVLFYRNRVFMHKRVNLTTIRVPKELGRNTKFTIESDDIDYFDIRLVSPNGTIYTKQTDEFRIDYSEMAVHFLIKLAAAGKWKVRFERKTKRRDELMAYISVTTESRVEEPIRTRSWMDTPFWGKELPPSTVINAEVTKRYNYIICADVIAIVDRPKDNPIMVMLKDNGHGPDKVANDGLYSAIFTQFNSNGIYGVTARVINNNKARLKLGVEDEKNNCK